MRMPDHIWGLLVGTVSIISRTIKKLAHAFRSLKYAQGIINGYFNFELSKEDQEKLYDLRFGVYNRDKARLDIEKEIEANRVELNKRLEENKIQKKITVDDMRILDNLILYHYTALKVSHQQGYRC